MWDAKVNNDEWELCKQILWNVESLNNFLGLINKAKPLHQRKTSNHECNVRCYEFLQLEIFTYKVHLSSGYIYMYIHTHTHIYDWKELKIKF